MLNMLLREKRLSVLLSGSLLSKIGDGIHEFVFIVTVLKVTGNQVVDAGLIYFFHFIPYLVLGPVGGVLSDRLPRKWLMLFSDLARMLITGAFCLLLMADQINAVVLAVLGMLMTACRTVFQPSFQGSIPSLVKSENLPAANGAAQITGEIGGLIGPAVGGAILALTASAGHVLIVDVVAYLLSTLCILAVRIPFAPAEQEKPEPLTLRNLYGDFWGNLREVMAQQQLLITIIYSSLCIFLVGAALRILIPAMMKGNGYDDSLIGYGMSLIAFGTIVGAVLCSKVIRDFSSRNLMLFWGVYGLVLATLPAFVFSQPAMLAACFALGAVGAFVDVILPTNIQQLSTNQNIGKNFSLFSTLANTGEALSGSFAGVLVLFSSVGGGVTAIGFLIAAVAWFGKFKAGGSKLETVAQHE